MFGHRTKTLMLATLTLLVCVLGADKTCFSNNLIEVRLGTDLKRMVIRAQEPIKDFSSFALHRPSRLVIDIPGCGAGDIGGIYTGGRGGSLAARVSGTVSGARVVLDFKRGSVPAHRIRRMDNCLVVFLEEWSIPATAPSSRPRPKGEEPPQAVQRTIRKPHQAEQRFEEHVRHQSGELAIKSAEVVDGLIVLQVAERKRPERLYRIELGVNLDSLGFDSAGIRPCPFRSGTEGGPGKTQPSREPIAREDHTGIPQVAGPARGQWERMRKEN